MKPTYWSEEEDSILKAHYAERGHKWIGWESLLPGRTPNSIYRHARSIGLGWMRERTIKKARPKKQNPVTRTRDPYEGYVLECLEHGMAPSDVDRQMKWTPGKTRLIMTSRWERMSG